MHIHISIHIYIYLYTNRYEHNVCICVHVYIYIYIYTHVKFNVYFVKMRGICSQGKKELVNLCRGKGLASNIQCKIEKFLRCQSESFLKISPIGLAWLLSAQWNTTFKLSETCIYISVCCWLKSKLTVWKWVGACGVSFYCSFHLYPPFKEHFSGYSISHIASS